MRELSQGRRIPDDLARRVVDYRLKLFDVALRRSQLEEPDTPRDVVMLFCMPHDLIGFVIYQQEDALRGLATQPERFGSWWPELQQRLLICYYLRCLLLKNSELHSLCVANSRNLMLFVKNVIRKTDPGEAVVIHRLIGCEASSDYVETWRETTERETEWLK